MKTATATNQIFVFRINITITVFTVILIMFFNTSVYSQTDSDTTFQNLLKMSLNEFMNLEVTTAGKTAQKISDVPASVIVIDRSEIETYGYSSVKEILESVPGFYITDDKSSTGKSICVRGYWSWTTTHVVLQVNGITQDYDGNIYFLEHMNIPVEAIERIEVIRGPMSVIYGSGAFYGAVNIITNKNERGPISSMVSTTIGNNNKRKAFVRVAGKKDDLHVAMNVSYDQNEGADLDYNDIIKDVPESLTGKSTGEDALTKKGEYFNLTCEYKGFYSDFTYVNKEIGFFYAVPPIPDENQSKRLNRTHVTLGYKNELNDYISIDTKFSLNKSVLDLDFQFTTSLEEYSKSLEQISFYEAEFNLFIKPLENLDIVTGAFYKTVQQKQEGDIPSIGYANYHWLMEQDEWLETYAYFGQLTFKPIENLMFVAGLRLEQQKEYDLGIWLNQGFEYYKQIYPNIEGLPDPVTIAGTVDEGDLNFIPRFAMVYSLTKNNVFKFLYGKAIKQPSVANNTDIVSFNYFNQLNNPDMEIQKIPYLSTEDITTYEFNYISMPFSKLTTNLSFFYNTLNNLVIRKIEIINGTWQPFASNAGKISSVGFELSALYRPIPELDLNVAVTFQESKDEQLNDIIPAASPNLLAYFKASYKLPSLTKNNKNNVFVSLSGNYIDEMYSVWDNTAAPNSGSENPNDDKYIANGRIGNPKSDDLLLINTNIRINNFIIDNAFLNFRISNLFDEQSNFPTFINNAWATKGIKRDGRQLLFSLGYKF